MSMSSDKSEDSDRSPSAGWSTGSSGATLPITDSVTTTTSTSPPNIPPINIPDRGRVRLSHAQASTGRLPLTSNAGAVSSPRRLKQLEGQKGFKPSPPSHPRPLGGSMTARARMNGKMMPQSNRGRTTNGNTTERVLRRRKTESVSLVLPIETKPTVLALQHFNPSDGKTVIPVLILSRMKDIAMSLMSACGTDPCIKCVVPDLDAPDFDQPGSGSVKAMRDARIAVVDPDMFSPLLRHAQQLDWLQCTARDSQTIADQLARVRSEAVRRKMQSQNLMRRLDEHRQRMADESNEIKVELAKVEPALEASRKAIASLTKRSVDELKSFTNPPDMVKYCLGAVFRMLACAKSSEPLHGSLRWAEILKITHKQGFIASVVEFDPGVMTRALRKRVQQEYLSKGSAAQLRAAQYHASLVAGHLHCWIVAQMKYAEALEIINPMKATIKKLESECKDMAEELERIEELTSGHGPNYIMTRISGGYGGMVAEFVMAQVIAHERNFNGLVAQQANHSLSPPDASVGVGRRDGDSVYKYRPLSDLTIGILGLGESGINVSRYAKAMGMRVLAVARRQRPLKRKSEARERRAKTPYTSKMRKQRILRRELGLGAHGAAKPGGYLEGLERRAKMAAYMKEKSEVSDEEDEDVIEVEPSPPPKKQIVGSYDCDPAYTPLHPNPETGEWADECYVAKDLPDVLVECDYVVVALPATGDTCNLLTEDSLKNCKPSCVLINVGASAVLPPDVIQKSLEDGIVSCVVTDSVDNLEEDSPLWNTPGFFVSPHVAARPGNALPEVVDVFVKNIGRKMLRTRMLYEVDFFDWDWGEQGKSRWKLLHAHSKISTGSG